MNYWSLERIQEATALFHAGVSASEAAAAIGGGITRSAVCGLWNRRGLKRGRVVERRQKPAARSTRGLTTAARLAVVAEIRSQLTDERAPELSPEQRKRAVPLMRLNARTCRWPYGDPTKPDFCFCGDAPVQGSPYCSGHHAVAYSGRAA